MQIELKDTETVIDKEQLKNLLDTSDALEAECEVKKAEIKKMYDASVKIFELIGLASNGVVKSEYFKEGGFSFKPLVSGAKDILGLLVSAGFSKKAEEKLTEKFAFFKDLMPVFEKYAAEFSTK